MQRNGRILLFTVTLVRTDRNLIKFGKISYFCIYFLHFDKEKLLYFVVAISLRYYHQRYLLSDKDEKKSIHSFYIIRMLNYSF